jgi:hypothetical protein
MTEGNVNTLFDPALADEFRRQPIGHHSPALERLLDRLRAGGTRGKYCLVCIVPHRHWQLARLSGERGVPPVPVPGCDYHTIEDAEWDVFRRRWEEEGGEPLGNRAP